jgi:NDP-sugar pyrophosphorylase family protein
MQHHKIAYGVCEIDNGGDLVIIKEKPEYNFLVNTGMYLLEPNVLDLIPQDTYYDMTDLISDVQEKGLKVGVFPISEKSWFDVGQWEKYTETVNYFEYKGCIK